MRDRMFATSFHMPGTLAANWSVYFTLPVAWTLLGVKSMSTNYANATLTVSGGATIAAALIGQGSGQVYHQPAVPAGISADELLVLALDYDGSAGTTKSTDVTLTIIGLFGEG